MLTVDVSETPAEAMPPLPGRLRPIAPLGAPTVSRRLFLTQAMTNGKAFDMGRVDTVAQGGDTELWEIVNPADMDHPFHIHGTQFQVVEHERDGTIAKPPYLAWKDTVNVARGETAHAPGAAGRAHVPLPHSGA